MLSEESSKTVGEYAEKDNTTTPLNTSDNTIGNATVKLVSSQQIPAKMAVGLTGQIEQVCSLTLLCCLSLTA